MTLRLRQATRSWLGGRSRFDLGGITASVPWAARMSRTSLASCALSPISRLMSGTLASNARPPTMSCTWPAVSERAYRRPSPSQSAWILVVRPPRERPIA